MTPPTTREISRMAPRHRVLDRVMSAPGADAARAEAIDAMRPEAGCGGDFPVVVDGWLRAVPLSALVKHLREHPGSLTRDQVAPHVATR